MTVPPHRFITNDPGRSDMLSSKACMILLLLYFHTGADNLIHKSQFIVKTGLTMDPRTWNKYWNELEANKIIAKSDIKTWMLSPHQCYTEGSSRSTLIVKWNALFNEGTLDAACESA